MCNKNGEIRNSYKYFVTKLKGIQPTWEPICRCSILPEFVGAIYYQNAWIKKKGIYLDSK